MRFISDNKFLVNVENENFNRRRDGRQISVDFGFRIDVGNALEPFADSSQTAWNLEIRQLIEFITAASRVRRGSNSKKRWLHRPRRNFEGLKEKCANPHCHRERNQ